MSYNYITLNIAKYTIKTTKYEKKKKRIVYYYLLLTNNYV